MSHQEGRIAQQKAAAEISRGMMKLPIFLALVFISLAVMGM